MNTVHIYHTNCRDHCKPQSRKQQGSVLLFHLVFLKQPHTTPPSPALASLHSPSLEPEAHFQALTLSWLCVMPSFLSPQHAASLPHCLGRPQMLVGQKAQPVMWGCCGGDVSVSSLRETCKLALETGRGLAAMQPCYKETT